MVALEPQREQRLLAGRGLGDPAALLLRLRSDPSWAFLDEIAAEDETGETTADGLIAYIAGLYGVGMIDLEEAGEETPALYAGLTRAFALGANLLPIGYEEDSVLVAVSDPVALGPLEELERFLGQPAKPVLVRPDVLATKIESVFDRLEQARDEEGGAEALGATVEDLRSQANDAPIIRLVNRVFREAIVAGASDIHVEVDENSLIIRYRVDGVLVVRGTHARRLHPPVVSRLKIMAGLDIAERRVPLDGRIRLVLDRKKYDIRVATTPSVYGEEVVMRILDKSNVKIDLSAVGFGPAERDRFAALLERPNGILLVTGPTGSGKTTTLYAGLHHLNHPRIKIITTEDPVEYELDGITQIEVNTKIDLTFARCLRSILRQDPDVVMVGEIRDLETARIAVQAALTGHLVLSTLHTNDAPSSISRLMDMGIESFMIGASVVGILAQRLVRRLCPSCKRPDPGGDGDLPVGCDACEKGYRGRMGLFELLFVSDEIRALIGEAAPLETIRKIAREQGMRTLYEDGLRRVAAGDTSRAEVHRVAGSTITDGASPGGGR